MQIDTEIEKKIAEALAPLNDDMKAAHILGALIRNSEGMAEIAAVLGTTSVMFFHFASDMDATQATVHEQIDVHAQYMKMRYKAQIQAKGMTVQ